MESQDLHLSICGSELILFPPYFGCSRWEYMRSSNLHFLLFHSFSITPWPRPLLYFLFSLLLSYHSSSPSPVSTLSPATSAAPEAGLGGAVVAREKERGKSDEFFSLGKQTGKWYGSHSLSKAPPGVHLLDMGMMWTCFKEMSAYLAGFLPRLSLDRIHWGRETGQSVMFLEQYFSTLVNHVNHLRSFQIYRCPGSTPDQLNQNLCVVQVFWYF